MSDSQDGGGGTRKPGASDKASKAGACEAIELIAIDNGIITKRRSTSVIAVTAAQRRPPSDRSSLLISGQLGNTSVAAHTVEAAKGLITRNEKAIRPPMNKIANIVRVRSFELVFICFP